MGFTATHFYMVCLFLGLIYSVFAVFFGHLIGGGHDVDVGHDIDLHAGDSIDIGADVGTVHFSPLSPNVIAMFMASFGGSGIICLEIFHTSFVTSLAVAVLCGLGFGMITYYFFAWMFDRVQGGVDVKVNDLIGKEAEINIPIPEQGFGEISYIAGGVRMTSPARSVDNLPIPARTLVKIKKIVGTSFIVERCDAQNPVVKDSKENQK